ncbi:SDR family oxidoreductase [Paenibacillus prosopidis]|uniref:NAD(P)-dependent dehydrogenase (Short-subunit alcohol dehydrogenase family) n=1 Tax=Paenibacillus prosopidis TaxID=630520 RepID=A0A368W8R2_9BACL|nr:SDR family oxidoreductase [Paenibacillus prosopidis]RCW52025.1 NAD(P)-dependent dehydrogenase (short-subunit alcohol dehydrogenase family) [Paenibacillus prosopidis]
MKPTFGSYTECETIPIYYPPQYQPQQPGIESIMIPRPVSENPAYAGSGKLRDKVAIITGGDSGIGRAVAYAFAKEGADIVVVYFNEHGDAKETWTRINQLGRRCLTLAGDIGDESFCGHVVEMTIRTFGRIDCLINNAAVQFYQESIESITREQLERTFRTNIFAMFYLTKAALPYLKPGSTIINTSSETAHVGFKGLIDYSATKGAINTFTRSLSMSLVDRGIRVNAVAPGRTWTPLQPASLPPKLYMSAGFEHPLRRDAQPWEIAPAFVYLASDDSTYVIGQVIQVNGGSYFGQ